MRHSKKAARLWRIATRSVSDMSRLTLDPSYFFIVWRWSGWLYALIVIILHPGAIDRRHLYFAPFFLVLTFLQATLVTLYRPLLRSGIVRFRLGRGRRQRLLNRQLTHLSKKGTAKPAHLTRITKLPRSSSSFWNLIRPLLPLISDLLLCDVVVFFTGTWKSPFYRYGLSAIIGTSLAYPFRGGYLAAAGYSGAFLLSAFVHLPGTPKLPFNLDTFLGAFVDPFGIATVISYISWMMSLLRQKNIRTKRNLTEMEVLNSVGVAMIASSSDLDHLLKQTVHTIYRALRYDWLGIILFTDEGSQLQLEEGWRPPLTAGYPAVRPAGGAFAFDDTAMATLLNQVRTTASSAGRFVSGGEGQPNIGQLYVPLRVGGQVVGVLAVESQRPRPFSYEDERLLEIVASQIAMAIENAHLNEQKTELAAQEERSRIAREIHDGIAQMIYMISLNLEAAAELSTRGDLGLTERLNQLIMVSKQALWETRHYVYNLKPLISGDQSLTQTLQNQISEFKTIGELPVNFRVEGEERPLPLAVSTAMFRIMQESLANVYKHAEAQQVDVLLLFGAQEITLKITDDGQGFFPEQATGTTKSGRHYGLGNMSERAHELGGTFHIESTPGAGTAVVVTMPYVIRQIRTIGKLKKQEVSNV